jgi:glycosyltransferase involved in cell wall biosynthesis
VTLTFRYTGGWNEMKGVRVLIAAARALPAGDWRVIAHDIDDFLVANDISLTGLPIDAVPSFAPSEAAQVWANTDVLLVPSIMRESHSLVTREALTAGVPVICTDTLGPEEVVEHGVNGLVVPAADADALADAMRTFIDDPSLVATMKQACHDIPVRALADQVDGLLALYAELGTGKRHERRPGVPSSEIGRVLFIAGIDGAPLRYRAFLPAEALALHGVHTDVRYYRDVSVPALADAADAIVVYRVPATAEVLELIDRAHRRGVPVVYDVDDLIFDPDLRAEIPALTILPPDEAELWLEGIRRYRTTMEACDAFVGSTHGLIEHAANVTGLPVHRFANGVGMLVAQQSDAALRKARSAGPLRIGYLSGTNTHDHDWAMVEPAVAEVMQRHSDVELWLVGLVEPSAALAPFKGRVKRIGFTAWTALPKVLRDLDINLAPLTSGSRFNEAKSAIKWLEAALVATPTVASPTEPFREAIEAGHNGLLADSLEGWTAAIESLVTDASLRRRLGTRARRDALLRWSPHLQAQTYADILASVLSTSTDTGGRKTSSEGGWTDVVAPSEPYVERPLERYELPQRWSMALPPPVRMQYRRFRAFAWRSYRTVRRYGPIGVVRRAPARLRRRQR